MASVGLGEKRVLAVGLVCLDLINVVEHFPVEDTGQRVLDQSQHRGGNASNNSTVLGALGVPCEFMGTIADTYEKVFLKESFAQANVRADNCPIHKGCACPVSVAIVNQQNGSRTILHSNKNLPELSFEEFTKSVDLSRNEYSWIHFEGRPSASEISRMLEAIHRHNATVDASHRVVTSVELEKTKPQLEILVDKADYVFISKEHAHYHGLKTKEETVQEFSCRCRADATVICPWGEDGAIGRSPDGTIVSSPIFPPERVVDTLGAGDTFIASTIAALNQGAALKEAVTFGCQVAGAKCGMQGFTGLKQFRGKIPGKHK